jgi:hypothetical protein
LRQATDGWETSVQAGGFQGEVRWEVRKYKLTQAGEFSFYPLARFFAKEGTNGVVILAGRGEVADPPTTVGVGVEQARLLLQAGIYAAYPARERGRNRDAVVVVLQAEKRLARGYLVADLG